MQVLNFPAFDFRVKNSENKTRIFDEIRKKFVVLQPEEWVRQHVLRYLTEVKSYPPSLIAVEREIKLHGLRKRFDIVVFNPQGKIEILVECKSPDISISQQVFDQLARYNTQLNANFLMVTNGLDHHYFEMDATEEKYRFLPGIPDFSL